METLCGRTYIRGGTSPPNEMPKRSFSRSSRGSGRTGSKRSRSSKRVKIAPQTRYTQRILATRAMAGVRRLNRMIETKDNVHKIGPNINLTHNQATIIPMVTPAGAFNPFFIYNGTTDDMGENGGKRIGDSIAVRGLSLRFFIQNQLGRPKVWYRIMLVKCAKGDEPTRANLYRQNTGNKMIDLINTERFTIIASKTFNVYAQGASAANTYTGVVPLAPGVPLEAPTIGGDFAGAIGTKVVSMWIPGRKFGRSGVVQYENNSNSQLKFFDYRLVVVAYDWYFTAQDANNVGMINEAYGKLYYKDA